MPITAISIFAFRGSRPRSSGKRSSIPPSQADWRKTAGCGSQARCTNCAAIPARCLSTARRRGRRSHGRRRGRQESSTPPGQRRIRMRRHHKLPCGGGLPADGVRFRLWAPRAHKVELLLAAPPAPALPMVAEPEGWFSLTTEKAGAGSRYRYSVDGAPYPDPASRYQPDSVHGASEVIDAAAYEWRDTGWHGRPWHELVIYELHLGAFSERGDFTGAIAHPRHLVELGVTAIELMPIAECPGRRNWGYDGVQWFAPTARYGRPEELKALIDACHARGIAILLDVVYNHFGPEGNYLHAIAPDFFTERHHTPWGAAINYDAPRSRPVRDCVLHNALYWLKEFHLDGLRLDAVHAILDENAPDILTELAETVRRHITDRPVHLVLENDRNEARRLARDYAAQWNDDLHHALHVLLTGETRGYYGDYAERPIEQLGRALATGFAYQGEPSEHRHEIGRASCRERV